jgi:hypothetical protein
MLPVTRWIFNSCLLFIAAALASGCTTATERLDQKLKVGEPLVKVFFAKYEDVEAALKLAMLRYPSRVDNTEAGIFETDYVKGDARFRPPHKNADYSSGYHYRILLNLVKGKTQAKNAVQVVVVKKIEVQRDFFAQPVVLPSDGLEESVILYRIGRELTIMKAIQKAQEKQNKKDSSSSGTT